jgi:hypothetical protein
MPSIPELQLLVPQSAASSRGPQPAAPPSHPRREVATVTATSTSRRRDRATLWQDSNFFQDSFFAPDNRSETPGSEFGTLSSDSRAGLEVHEGPPTEPPTEPPPEGGAIVVEAPRQPSTTRH